MDWFWLGRSIIVPRNVNIKQDPLSQALEVFQQTFGNIASNTIEQRGITERRNIEETDRRIVQSMDKLLAMTPNMDVPQMEQLIGEFDSLLEQGSKRLMPLGQTLGSYFSDQLETKKEEANIVQNFNTSLDELRRTLKDDEFNKSEAAKLLSSVRKNKLDILITDPRQAIALAKSVKNLSDLDTYGRAKIGLYEFDDQTQEGFQLDPEKDIGDLTKTSLKSAFRMLETDPDRALELVRNIPAAELGDTKAVKAVTKAINKEKATQNKLSAVIERKSFNDALSNKINSVKEVFKNTEIKEVNVQPFSAKIRYTAQGDISNIDELKVHSANMIYQLHNRLNDASVPKEADELLSQIKVAENTGDKEVIDLAKQELANWWVNHTTNISDLDFEKAFEFISDAKEGNREKLMIDVIDIFKTVSGEIPRLKIENKSSLSPEAQSILDDSIIVE